MKSEATKLGPTVRDEPDAKKSEVPKRAFVKPELKQWGSVEKVTGFTF